MKQQLDTAFLQHTEAIMGPSRFARFIAALDEEPPVSIRLNRAKFPAATVPAAPVPWCPDGLYLDHRPNFTFDPLLHAGCYYVQEAASMFITHVVSSLCLPLLTGGDTSRKHPLTVLDLCAAPGGKSTALRSVLPPDSLLVSNEPVRQRAQILSENIQKWGHPNCIVTNNYPADIAAAMSPFDIILCDVPCSGEGMFRKDPATIAEWSTKNVERCQQLQRQIVGDIWPCLRPGGILIYSTCTYNTHENEENVRWIMGQFGADCLEVPTNAEWGITGSLLQGFDVPICRFVPGITRSEGLFMAVLRKPTAPHNAKPHGKGRKATALNILFSSVNQVGAAAVPVVDLPYPTAIAYLRREAIVLPASTPKGLVIVAFEGHPLGYVKNIGTRANNLYPREWAIKSTHVPDSYTPVLS